jgi:hypothetical protein
MEPTPGTNCVIKPNHIGALCSRKFAKLFNRADAVVPGAMNGAMRSNIDVTLSRCGKIMFMPKPIKMDVKMLSFMPKNPFFRLLTMPTIGVVKLLSGDVPDTGYGLVFNMLASEVIMTTVHP